MFEYHKVFKQFVNYPSLTSIQNNVWLMNDYLHYKKYMTVISKYKLRSCHISNLVVTKK